MANMWSFTRYNQGRWGLGPQTTSMDSLVVSETHSNLSLLYNNEKNMQQSSREVVDRSNPLRVCFSPD